MPSLNSKVNGCHVPYRRLPLESVKILRFRPLPLAKDDERLPRSSCRDLPFEWTCTQSCLGGSFCVGRLKTKGTPQCELIKLRNSAESPLKIGAFQVQGSPHFVPAVLC